MTNQTLLEKIAARTGVDLNNVSEEFVKQIIEECLKELHYASVICLDSEYYFENFAEAIARRFGYTTVYPTSDAGLDLLFLCYNKQTEKQNENHSKIRIGKARSLRLTIVGSDECGL